MADLTKEIEILIGVNDDGIDLSGTIAAIQDEFGEVEIELDVGADVSEAESAIEGIETDEIELEVGADVSEAESAIEGIDTDEIELEVGADVSDAESAIEGIETDEIELEVGADVSEAESAIDGIETDEIELDVGADVSEVESAIDGIETDEIELEVGADVSEAESAIGDISSQDVTVDVDADVSEAETAIASIEIAEIQAQVALDIATVQADAQVAVAQLELAGQNIEWTARLNIAEVQANAQKVEAIMSGLESVFQSSGEIISSALGGLKDGSMMNSVNRYIKEVVDKELALRKEALEITKKLAQAEIDYMKAKTDAMQRGDAMITIDGAGLQPHLEAFMWEILSAIQVRANEEGMDMLLGT